MLFALHIKSYLQPEDGADDKKRREWARTATQRVLDIMLVTERVGQEEQKMRVAAARANEQVRKLVILGAGSCETRSRISIYSLSPFFSLQRARRKVLALPCWGALAFHLTVIKQLMKNPGIVFATVNMQASAKQLLSRVRDT